MSHAFSGLSERPPQGSEGSWTPETLDEGIDVIQKDGPGDRDPERRHASIQLVVQEPHKSGRYILTDDDPEFRKIMQSGIEREAAKLNGKAPRNIRDLVFRHQFTTFDRQNPRASQSPFHGFFTLFWLAMALLLVKIAAQNYKNMGSVFGRAEILHLMVDRDLVLLLTTDAIMCLATSFGFFLHKAIAHGLLTWSGSGWVIQSLYQLVFTVGFIWVCFHREWPWTHNVFIVMHDLVLLMKQHSYAFSNGYLSQVYRRKTLLLQKLQQLEDMEAHDSPTASHAGTSITTGLDDREDSSTLRHRPSIGLRCSTNLTKEQSEIATMAEAMESGDPLDIDQIHLFKRVIHTEITFLDEDLRGKCTKAGNSYPNNLTFYNFAEWICLPTLVYELEYPRIETINWWYVAEKSAATLGVIWIMIIISQAYIYPVVVETVGLKQSGISLDERWKEFPWVVSDMLFPLLLEQLLAWYVIWECLLNVLAELTRFADRGFYGDWWNAVSWDQYARDWNRPVHAFLLRHVYHSSISAFHLSKMGATFATFLLSAVVHEVLMFCLFKKVRGYLFASQMSQVPLAALSRTRFLKGRQTLGNVMFWLGLFIGPSVITSLYLIV
ncbi:MBOAT-domain-containing protein [Aaosphaeria arxii CBS 175.79]|uniref:O-acyltransferase n=1 Tax=Aaosphaeria arxii CBS 175.79 TaxID=1450172 RepID=A0A6A5X6E5_9PLEO|nr:MBOAT-domain-containing protein [Aaosphaeria arxii CBS 175.79]KAF2008451.1 MBOAT-domain-containing protein [Aaosphaeria arxii CBS 175.79]